jgi:demethylmenaquinone methyltransferase/2-methoxy-6-polyprenyl-1,4-benzoquinol methylase
VSGKALAEARRKHHRPNLSFVKAPAKRLHLEDARFDHVILFSCFPHLSSKAMSLREARRVLTPHGMLLIAHDMGRRQMDSIQSDAGQPVDLHHLAPAEDFGNLARSEGFETLLLWDEEEHYAVLARKL